MEDVVINHLAVIAAALSTFLLGGLWYSPILFGKAWQSENNFSDEDLKKGNMAKIFGLSFIFSLVMAYNLAFFLGSEEIGISEGLMYGLFTGLGWVAMAIFIIGLFEQKSARYLLINGCYMIVSFTIMGLIISAWR